MSLAIFNTEAEAIDYATDVHNNLTNNRPRYNATKWADPIQSADLLSWSVKKPVDDSTDTGSADMTIPLPGFGVECVIDQFYLWKGDILKCRQTHNRTIYDPKDTPALFSYFRDNSDQLEWIEGEQVEVGWVRIYNDVKYEVTQAHQTQSDWTPDVAVTLWEVYTEQGEEYPVWSQPAGGHDAYQTDDIVWFPTEDSTLYKSLIDANVWSPTVYPAGWEEI